MSLLINLVLVFFAFRYLWSFPSDIDLWWHLKTGEVMWQTKSILSQDIFSYTAYGNEWINHEWLAEIILYLVYHHLGPYGLIALKLLIGFTILFCLYNSSRMLSREKLLSLIFSILSFHLISGRLMDRPAIWSTFFITLLLYWVTAVFQSQKPKKIYLIFPLLFGLWGNLHGGTVVGLAILFLFWSPEVIRRYREGLHCPWWQKEEWIYLGCVLATLVNPFGLRLLTFPFENLQLSVAREATVEWKAIFDPGILNYPYIKWIPYFTLVLGLSFLLNRNPIRLSYLWTLGLTTIMAMKAVRFYAEFCLMAAPVCVYNVSDLLKRFRWRFIPWTKSVLLILFLVFLIGKGIQWFFKLGSIPKQKELILASQSPRLVPDIADFLERNNITGKMFNDINLGSNLIFFRGPKEKVFFDGRHNIYGDAYYLDYLHALESPIAFESLSKKYGEFDYVLLGTWAWPLYIKLHIYLWRSKDWYLVYHSHKGYIYLRDVKKFRDIIAKYHWKNPPLLLSWRHPFLKPKSYPKGKKH